MCFVCFVFFKIKCLVHVYARRHLTILLGDHVNSALYQRIYHQCRSLGVIHLNLF